MNDDYQITFAVGITTAPRQNHTLLRTLKTLRRSGFATRELTVFAEPGSLPTPSSLPRIDRPRRFGAWHNWKTALEELLSSNPDASAIMLVQDDTVFCKGLRPFLDRVLWPTANTGLVSLYTPTHYSQVFCAVDGAGKIVHSDQNPNRVKVLAVRRKLSFVRQGRPSGFVQIHTHNMYGACALIFPRTVAEQILAHRFVQTWRGVSLGRPYKRQPFEVANIDTCIGQTMMDMRRECRFAVPSLAQHVAEVSSIGHSGLTEKRCACDFVGEDFDASENLSDWSTGVLL